MIDQELIYQAHDRLHKGDVKTAHEILHKALGMDNDAPPSSAIGHRRGFDMAFVTACRKNGVRAAYVLIDSESSNGSVRLISGGDAELCELVDRKMRS